MIRALFAFLLFFSVASCYSSETAYPYKINNISEIETGSSVVVLSDSSEYIYKLTYIFTTGDEQIKIEDKKSKSKSTGAILKNTRILSQAQYDRNLIILCQKGSSYFVSILNSDCQILQESLLIRLNLPVESDKCKIIEIIENNKYLVSIDNKLFSIEFDQNGILKNELISQIEGGLLDLDNKSGLSVPEYSIIEESGSSIIINFYDHKNSFLFLSKLVNYRTSKWADLGTHLAFLSSPVAGQSFIQVIDKNSGFVTANFWIESDINLICLKKSNDGIRAIYISSQKDGYYIRSIKVNDDNSKNFEENIKLGENLVNPFLFSGDGNNYYLLTANNIIIYDQLFNILSEAFFSQLSKICNNSNFEVQILSFSNNYYYIIMDTGGIKFQLTGNDFWLLKRIYFEFKNYMIIIFLVIFLLIFIQLYRHQKRLSKELLELPTAGLLFVVDSVGRLTRLNSQAMEFLEINDSTTKRKFFRFYTRSPKSLPFADLIDKVLDTKDNYNGKITLMIDGSETEWLCKAITIRNLTGMFRGVVLSAVDITEQLERKRLSNWAQLAHDMQTNLSTIKLNAEHLDIDTSDNNKVRQKRILFQASILMQRVRDIVTVGRNDKTNFELHNSGDICAAVRHEFDELMFPNVEFEVDPGNFQFQCDQPKLIRAIRNAVENGVKSFKGNAGKIKISSHQERGYTIFAVEDNGAGMDEETKKKMLTPYFTTAAKSGGSGIGTMIMQHVAEIHNGKIVVESEKGVGTQVIFYIPNTFSPRK